MQCSRTRWQNESSGRERGETRRGRRGTPAASVGMSSTRTVRQEGRVSSDPHRERRAQATMANWAKHCAQAPAVGIATDPSTRDRQSRLPHRKSRPKRELSSKSGPCGRPEHSMMDFCTTAVLEGVPNRTPSQIDRVARTASAGRNLESPLPHRSTCGAQNSLRGVLSRTVCVTIDDGACAAICFLHVQGYVGRSRSAWQGGAMLDNCFEIGVILKPVRQQISQHRF